jgi:ferritin-like metal-binding protein YciE
MINQDTHLARTSTGSIVNNDSTAYQAAKMRRKRDNHINGLEVRINKLEECVNCLQQTLEEIRNK